MANKPIAMITIGTVATDIPYSARVKIMSEPSIINSGFYRLPVGSKFPEIILPDVSTCGVPKFKAI